MRSSFHIRRQLAKLISWIAGLSLGSFLFTVLLAAAALAIFVRTSFFQEAFRDQIVSAVQSTMQAEISYESADVHLFRLYPRLTFSQVRIVDKFTDVDVAIDEISVSISLFVSLPLLLFREIYIEQTRVAGLSYELKDLRVLERWKQRVRPPSSGLDVAFRTRIRAIHFENFNLDLQLTGLGEQKRDLLGRLFLNEFDIELDGNDFWLNGAFEFADLQSGAFRLDEGRLEIEDVLLQDDSLRFDRIFVSRADDYLEISGRLDSFEDPEVQVDIRSSLEMESYLANSVYQGRVVAVGQVQGRLEAPQAVFEVESKKFRLRGREFDSVSVRGRMDHPLLNLTAFELKDGEESVTGSGVWSLKSGDPRSRISLNLKDLQLGPALAMVHPDRASWEGRINSSLVLSSSEKAPLLEAAGKLDVENFTVRNTEEDLIYRAPHSVADLQLYLSDWKTGGFNVRLNNPGGDWLGGSEWRPGYFNISWDGKLNGQSQGELFQFDLGIEGRIQGFYGGPVDRMVIDMDLDCPLFRLDQLEFAALSGKLRFVDRVLFGDPIVFDGGRFTGGLFFPKQQNTEFRDFRFEFSQQDLNSVFSSLEQTQNWFLQPIGEAGGSGELNGWIRRPVGEGVLLTRDVRFERDRTRGRFGKANWQFQDGVLYFRDLFVETSREAGGVRGEISFTTQGIRDFDLRGREVRLMDWLILAGFDLPINSLTDFELKFSDSEDSLNGNIRLFETSVGTQVQADSQISIEILSNRLRLKAALFGEGILIEVNKENRSQIEAALKFEDFNAINFLPHFSSAGLEFDLSGSGLCQLKYPRAFLEDKAYEKFFRPWDQMSCDMTFKQTQIRRASLLLQEIDSFDLKVESREGQMAKFSFPSLRLRSQDRLLNLSGYYRSPKDLSVSLSGSTPLESLSYFTDVFKRSEGVLEVEGDWTQAGFNGRLNLRRTSLVFEHTPIQIRDITADLRAQNSQFDLLDFVGRFREGSVSGRGRFRLEGFQLSSANLNLQLNGPVLEPDRGIRFQASGPVNVIADNKEAVIRGDLNVYNASFRKRVNLRSDVMNFFERKRGDRFDFFDDQKGFFDDWKLDIGLRTSDPVSIRNNLAEGQVDLRLRLAGTIGEPRLNGSIQILSGTFNYFNREFVVQSGSVQFSDPASNIPRYDIRAEAEIDQYRIFINLFGDRSEQRIAYSSEPPLQEKEILALVSYGTPPTDQNEIRNDDLTTSAAFTGISFFTGQLQDTIEGALATDLGIQRFQINPAFFEETGKTELQLKIGTDLIRNRLQLNYYNFVSAEGGHQVELDLRVNRNLSLVGSWKDSSQSADRGTSGDLGGDIIFRFEIE